MNQVFGICKLSLVPLRAEASDRSEMISQLLFGDTFEILEQTDKWSRIRTAYDEYEGWMDTKQMALIEQETFENLQQENAILGLSMYHPVKNTRNGETLNLVAGSSLPGYKNGQFSLNLEVYTLLSPPVKPDSKWFTSQVENAARFYFNTPYLWGGRSAFGIDCSGFSQMVFKQFGIRLKRDAWQQALQGQTVDFLQEVQAGDLAFFDNEEGRITHVGIMLNHAQIIHASARVKIDAIDTEGIYSEELKRYTHKLRIIKRFV